MQLLTKGKYFGRHNRISENSGLIISDTEYTHEKVDWHYHENIYFTFLLEGKLFEANKNESFECLPGSLLFHNRQDAHYNIKPPGYARGFHIEVEKKWFNNYYEDDFSIEGSFMIQSPLVKQFVRKIFIESKSQEPEANITIGESLINIFSLLKNDFRNKNKFKPEWVKKIREILNEELPEKISLKYLASQLNLHPVYLSRSFPFYYKCSIGDYIRKIKIEKALNLITASKLSISEISYQCGFSDQSHFIRHFKRAYNITPNQYKAFIL